MRGSAAGAAAAQGSAAGAVAARDWAARAAAGSPVEASKRVWRKPTYWPRGVRCIGGMTLIRALVRNLRTCPTMPREKAQAANLRGRKYRCGGQGRTAL